MSIKIILLLFVHSYKPFSCLLGYKIKKIICAYDTMPRSRGQQEDGHLSLSRVPAVRVELALLARE